MIHGIGVDIVEIARIEKAIKRWDKGFLAHVFNAEEVEYAQKHKFPAQHLAARFAAKEAIVKAIGDNAHIGWKDITILNDKNGTPYCVMNKKKFKNKNKILISLSHTDQYAVANAIMVRLDSRPALNSLTTGHKRRTRSAGSRLLRPNDPE